MRVFDFDNTIYDGESGLDIVLYFLSLDTKNVIKYMPKFLKGFMKYKNGSITIDEVIGVYGSFLKEYCDSFPGNMQDEFQHFWDKNEHKIKNFYREMRREDDVIVSACPRELLEVMTDRLGIKNVICSEVSFTTGEIQAICYKDKKVEMFKEVYGDAVIDEFYTDSVADKPMVELSRTAYMVDGDKIRMIKKDGIMLENI